MVADLAGFSPNPADGGTSANFENISLIGRVGKIKGDIGDIVAYISKIGGYLTLSAVTELGTHCGHEEKDGK